MSKIQKLLFSIFLVFLVVSVPALAGNNVSEIDIEVTVRDDGSAYIVQTWQGVFTDGTENYISINTEDISLSDFAVSDVNGAYTFVESWDIDWGFSKKARKCGIVKTNDGVELCFGISEYGENRYAIEYVVSDFIKSYTDFDGTNFMFINPDMSTFPTDAHISIVMQNGTKLDENNAGIWAFGYEGYVEFLEGNINAYTTSALENDDSMIVMLRLDQGIIFPKTTLNESFETVMQKAFDGSDYGEQESLFEKVIGAIVGIVIFVVLILCLVFYIKRKNALRKFYQAADYFREVPNSGEMEISHYLAQNFDVAEDKSLIIGALILSMINQGSIEPQLEENVGIFGKVKESVNLKLVKEPSTVPEISLYHLLKLSAGDDGILQEKELEQYAYKHPEQINAVVENVAIGGEQKFTADGGFLQGAGNCIKDLSDHGKEELSQVMGLKKYLEDFTLIAERSVTETVIWKEYLVYATLFGIADKVLKQLKTVYPEKIPELEYYNRNVIVAHSYYHSMHHSAQKALQARRTGGMGGRASMGGGGGFSGGGHGGGSR